MIQIDHDWDHDGNVADSYGHTYYGLQIIDAQGKPRGFIFSDASWSRDSNTNRIMSSIFYLDESSKEALTGIE